MFVKAGLVPRAVGVSSQSVFFSVICGFNVKTSFLCIAYVMPRVLFFLVYIEKDPAGCSSHCCIGLIEYGRNHAEL